MLGCASIPRAWQPAPGAGIQGNGLGSAVAIAVNMRVACVEKIRKDTTRNWWGASVVDTEFEDVGIVLWCGLDRGGIICR